MPCPKTQHLLTEYFSDDLLPLTREGINKHLQSCQNCKEELDLLLAARDKLASWDDQRVPIWDRGLPLFRQEHRLARQIPAGWFWQWVPSAASLLMLALLLLNVNVNYSSQGVTVAFGGSGTVEIDALMADSLAAFENSYSQQQNRELQAFLARMDERQDSNNLRLMQTVLEQTNQLSSDTFEKIYSYFEQQRQMDLQSVQVGYQQLADSDYETIQTMQRLVNFVRFQGDVR